MKQADTQLLFGYVLGIMHLATKNNILFGLSAIATILAIINHLIQIRKNTSK